MRSYENDHKQLPDARKLEHPAAYRLRNIWRDGRRAARTFQSLDQDGIKARRPRSVLFLYPSFSSLRQRKDVGGTATEQGIYKSSGRVFRAWGSIWGVATRGQRLTVFALPRRVAQTPLGEKA